MNNNNKSNKAEISTRSLNYALKIENLLKKISVDVDEQGIIRQNPYEEIIPILYKQKLQRPALKSIIDSFIDGYSADKGKSIDDLVKDGYDFDNMLKELEEIINAIHKM